MNVLTCLRERGFIEQTTSDELEHYLNTPQVVYVGFDPTADSLHLGNLVAIMGLAWFEKFGHQAVAIVGGATGMIGDPSGRLNERQLLDLETLQNNVVGITENLLTVLKQPKVLNNYDWFASMSCLDFLRDVGRQFRIGVMLAKDSVKSRLHSDEGMSFTEFSYQLLQGYDFLYLYQHHNVSIQMGGSDQWGNITAGTDLIRKCTGKAAFGITFPLLVDKDGKKFGKSARGAIWLSAKKLAPYHFYQYLLNINDEDVWKLLRLLTFLPLKEIQMLEEESRTPAYQAGTAQRLLAKELTLIIHKEEGLKEALATTELLKPGHKVTLGESQLQHLADTGHAIEISSEQAPDFLSVIVACGFAESKGQARRLIQNGGISFNEERVTDEKMPLKEGVFLLSAGKKHKAIVKYQCVS